MPGAARAGIVGRAAPCTALVVPAAGRQPQRQPQRQRQQQQQQLVSCWMAGWVRLRGTLQVHPCKLGRRIHAAHAPATGPTPPSTDLRELSGRRSVMLLAGVDLGRPVDPRHAWMLFEIFDFQWRFIHAWRGSTGQREPFEGGAVSDCGASAPWMARLSLQGRTCGVPAIRHRTALPQNAAVASAVAVEVAGQRPALPGATGHGPAATASDRRPPRVARPALRPPPPGHGRHAPPRR
ncbi:hypothetical protein FJP69_00335 [Stenotrophomonas maltophilia]|nr:hypothetical protein FJP69_00335 [Stenotrophomonas maltophilia]